MLAPATRYRLRKLARLLTTTVVRTDRRRWQNLASDREFSSLGRNRIIAGFIPDGSSVLDLGAGTFTLRDELGQRCEYQPADLTEGVEGVLYCDFNAGIYPAVENEYDYVVCSGVLEYLTDPAAFLSGVRHLGRRMLLSYCETRSDRGRLKRMANGFKNHLSRAELERLFDEAGYAWELKADWRRDEYAPALSFNAQCIYQLKLASAG